MRNTSLFVWCSLCAILFVQFSSAQCGVSPVSGTNSVTLANQVLNTYYPGTGNPVAGSTSLTVGAEDTREANNADIAAGDLVVIIQMQGADINSDNSTSYGSGTGTSSGYQNTNLYAGHYEYNTVSSVAGATINFAYPLVNNYYSRSFTTTEGIRTYQVIRIPREYDLTIEAAASVTAPSWNGSTGGVVVLDAANTLTINGAVDVMGKGFRGGGGKHFTGAGANNTSSTSGMVPLAMTDFRFYSAASTSANTTGGAKGEGIAGTPRYVAEATATTSNSFEGYIDGSMGRGAPGNAGGGSTDGNPTGNTFNTGGGGGGNGGSGGQGGSGWHGGTGDVTTYQFGGRGGSALNEHSLARLIMGGGGGAGTANNSPGTDGFPSSGAPGGGIIILRAKFYAGTGTLNANGAPASNVTVSGNTDAAGGGGAAGTVVAVTTETGAAGLNTITATAVGGKGGNMETYFDHGPGGGGGGGLIYTNGVFGSTDVSGGLNGLTRFTTSTGSLTNPFGAAPGTDGQLISLTGAAQFLNGSNAVSPCGVLPITITSFTAKAKADDVVLNWETENAVSFHHFEIEYSSDGRSFNKIGEVAYLSSVAQYQFLHEDVNSLSNHYRLRLVDNDGSARYSAVAVVRTNGNNASTLLIYPQPAHHHFFMEVNSERQQVISVSVINASGTTVKTENFSVGAGHQKLDFQNLQGLGTGVYLIKTRLNNKTITQKLLVDDK